MLLSKPIKFYNEMQELFRNSNADGSLAMDAANCMNDTQDDEDNDLNDDNAMTFQIMLNLKMI
jgi:hypothetical protein